MVPKTGTMKIEDRRAAVQETLLSLGEEAWSSVSASTELCPVLVTLDPQSRERLAAWTEGLLF